MRTMPIPAKFRAMIKDGPDVDLQHTDVGARIRNEQRKLKELAKIVVPIHAKQQVKK